MSSIPEDIYQEILLRVPVKSLLVCKCVCRNWYDLISSSDFVKLHLDFTTQKNNPSLMVQHQGRTRNGLKSICYDSLASSVCEIENVSIEMEFPFKSLNYNVQLVGSCNGLLCIELFAGSSSAGRVHFLCLWNPATRECKQIPKSPARSYYIICAFGYDHKTDDYKLAVGEDLRDRNTLVHVYSLALNSWKPAQTVPYWFYNYMQRNGVLANGDLHWLTMIQSKISLHSLDISEENFKQVQLALPLINWNSRMVLGALEGHLCILVDSFANGIKNHLEVWEMLDYGVEESWTRRFIITHQSIIENVITSTSPVWCFENGKILFTSSNYLVLYDPERGSAIKLNSYDNFARLAVNYFESLVSLKSGTYVGPEGGIEELREI